MLEISFELEGTIEMARRFKGIDAELKDFKPEFDKSASFLGDFFGGEVFDTRGAVIGEPWKPRKKSYPWPLLEKTGRMRGGFKTKAEKMRAEVWNAVDYFKYHQSRMPRKRLPRRVMMKLDEQRKNRIIKIFHESIIRTLREN